MKNKKVLKFILNVLLEQEENHKHKMQLVLDSLYRSDKDKERYKKKWYMYLGSIFYIINLLHTIEAQHS